jgi:hypothetical protein
MRNFFIGLLVGAAVVFVVLYFGCRPKDTPEGLKADTVLMEDPAWRDSAALRQQVIDSFAIAMNKVRKQRNQAKDSTKKVLAQMDSLKQAVGSGAPLLPGMSPHDSIFSLSTSLTEQTKVANKCTLEVVPALQRELFLAEIQIGLADSTITKQKEDRIDCEKRLNRVTSTLADLRAATKPGNKWLGIRMPWYVEDGVKVLTAGTIGFCFGSPSC